MNVAETLLEEQLRQAGIGFEREFPFAKGWGRRWRADFAITTVIRWNGPKKVWTPARLLIEIDGGAYVGGRHSRGTGVEADCEKTSAAAILGYRVLRLTPKQVEDGRGLLWIRQALGLEATAWSA